MRRVLLSLCVCLSLFFTACAAAPSPEEFQKRAENALPSMAGVWYTDEAEPWEKGYLSEEIESRFFGETEMTGVCYRLFLGTDDEQMAELLIASFETETDAVRAAEHLAARLSALQARAGEEFSLSLSDAAVYRKGRTVLYTAMPYNEKVIALFKR